MAHKNITEYINEYIRFEVRSSFRIEHCIRIWYSFSLHSRHASMLWMDAWCVHAVDGRMVSRGGCVAHHSTPHTLLTDEHIQTCGSTNCATEPPDRSCVVTHNYVTPLYTYHSMPRAPVVASAGPAITELQLPIATPTAPEPLSSERLCP